MTICPRCKDGKVLLRTTKKMSTKYKNNQFMGCSNYPKCRYNKAIKLV